MPQPQEVNKGEFSHAYDNGIDEHPGVFLYFRNVYTLNLAPPQVDDVIEDLCLCISHESYQKLRQYMIDNPIPNQIGF